MKHKGIHTHRFRDNPEEKRFAGAWQKANDQGHILDYLLDPNNGVGGRPPETPARECVVAATVLQWLGSPVGQAFLRDLGYERKT